MRWWMVKYENEILISVGRRGGKTYTHGRAMHTEKQALESSEEALLFHQVCCQFCFYNSEF